MGRSRRRVIARRKYHCGLNPRDVADGLGISERSYRAFEAGDSMLADHRLPRLRQILGDWNPEEMRLAIEDDGGPVVPDGHSVSGPWEHLASLEQGAARLWRFEPVVVPGLLQTAAYADAVERVGPEPRPSDDEIGRRVELRLARQEVLRREPDPLDLAVVLDESVLHRVAGGARVMAGQLDHLVAMAEVANVDVRVLPFDSGVFSAAFGAFTVFTYDRPFMACVDDRSGPNYLPKPHEIAEHVDLFEYLTDVALPPAESAHLIRTIAKEKYR